MSFVQSAAILAAALSVLAVILQNLLAAGLPLGRAAWGGRHRVLPTKLRWASLLAAIVLWVAVWIVLARAGLAYPGSHPTAIRAACWIFGGLFCINTLGNLMSRSPLERYVMTPATLVLAMCFVVVAMSTE